MITWKTNWRYIFFSPLVTFIVFCLLLEAEILCCRRQKSWHDIQQIVNIYYAARNVSHTQWQHSKRYDLLLNGQGSRIGEQDCRALRRIQKRWLRTRGSWSYDFKRYQLGHTKINVPSTNTAAHAEITRRGSSIPNCAPVRNAPLKLLPKTFNRIPIRCDKSVQVNLSVHRKVRAHLRYYVIEQKSASAKRIKSGYAQHAIEFAPFK